MALGDPLLPGVECGRSGGSKSPLDADSSGYFCWPPLSGIQDQRKFQSFCPFVRLLQLPRSGFVWASNDSVRLRLHACLAHYPRTTPLHRTGSFVATSAAVLRMG